MSRIKSVVTKVWGYLTKFEGPKTRRQKWTAGLLGGFALVVIFMFWGCPPAHVVPVWGRSMHVTIKIVTIPEPLGFLSFSGWVHYDPNGERKVNAIAYFRGANPKDIEAKRITKENKLADGSKRYWMEPDNVGVTGEGSGEGRYNWIPENQIIGIVDQIWTPERLFGCMTAMGKFRNWARFRHWPGSLVWSPDNRRVAVIGISEVAFFDLASYPEPITSVRFTGHPELRVRNFGWSGKEFTLVADAAKPLEITRVRLYPVPSVTTNVLYSDLANLVIVTQTVEHFVLPVGGTADFRTSVNVCIDQLRDLIGTGFTGSVSIDGIERAVQDGFAVQVKSPRRIVNVGEVPVLVVVVSR